MPRLSVVQPSSDSSTKPSSTESALLGLPLESVLEPGTGKKMAAALGARFGVDTALASADDVSSFERIIALVERLVAAKKTGAPASTSNDERKHVDLKTLESDVRRVLLANMVAKTGYPLEMLTEDLDLEADLGIDTVKQVEIFAKTREQFGIPRDAAFVLRDFNTLGKFIAYVVARAPQQQQVSAPAATSAQPTASPATVRSTLLSMSLAELGLSETEKQKLAKALAGRLGVSSPNVGGVTTLDELVSILGSGGKAS